MHRSRRVAQAGVTLVELMVVITIIGITASLAVQLTRKEPVGEQTKEVWLLFNQARETAISGGPVDADVAIATGISARAMLRATTIGGNSVIEVYRFYEVIPPGNVGAGFPGWLLENQVGLDEDVMIYGWDPQPEQYEHAPAWVPTNVLGGGNRDILFNSDGSADGATLYLGERQDPTNGVQYRVFMFPLSGQAGVYKEW